LLRLPAARSKKNALSLALLETIEGLRPAFADARVYARVRQLMFASLATRDRHTISAVIEAAGRSQLDWSGDYRVFSRDSWTVAGLFGCLLPQVVSLQPSTGTVCAALDDTNIKKTGTHIPGVAYRRDPMSPPFHTNFVRAQRFVQTSLLVPFQAGPSGARAIPVGFDHAPSARKIAHNLSDVEKREHRKLQEQHSLSHYAIASIEGLRNALDAAGSIDRKLLITVDGSYTNQNVIRALPDRTQLIGRIRKDAVLHQPPVNSSATGRPASYGAELTPEGVRQDLSIPWKSVKVFAAGRIHDCEVKEITPLLWRKTGPALRQRLIVVRPLSYRKTKNSRLLYRQPAYLITNDLDTPLAELLQAYFWRWDIEVNHRDEKQLIGVGQAQVRCPRAAERAPAFAVACYSALLIAAARAFGVAGTAPVVEQPKWRRRTSKKIARLSTHQLLRRLALEHEQSPISTLNFSNFAPNVARSLKSPKLSVSFSDAIKIAFSGLSAVG
jgi:hypothetical protein